MTDRRSSSDLGSNAEAILSAFPFPERDWESDARAIEARLLGASHDSTDDTLLAAPLPSEANEPSPVSATTTPLANSGVRTQSLAELARRSVEKKQAAQREMAKESLAIAAQPRPIPAPPLAPVTPIASVNAPPANALVATPSRVPKLAIALPALALAAAALFWFRPPAPAPSSASAPQPSALTPRAPAAIAENHAAPAEELPRGVDPNSLPGEAQPIAEPSRSKLAPAPAASVATALTPAKPTTGESTAGAAQLRATEQVEKSLPPDPGMRPADSSGGQLPTKPSSGAVQAALGSVLSGARHCVAGDDAPSTAVVVFGSDGRVQRVTVSGAAAGKSSSSCIEAQLSRARVQPFAAPNFSVSATVRPE